jgi:hypothetical protein
MSRSLGGAYDPSVADDVDTSPYEWGGIPSQRWRVAIGVR